MRDYTQIGIADAALVDPATPPGDLAQIASAQPTLGARVAWHPNAYPALLMWLAAYGAPDARAAAAQRLAVPMGPAAPAPGAPRSAAPIAAGVLIAVAVIVPRMWFTLISSGNFDRADLNRLLGTYIVVARGADSAVATLWPCSYAAGAVGIVTGVVALLAELTAMAACFAGTRRPVAGVLRTVGVAVIVCPGVSLFLNVYERTQRDMSVNAWAVVGIVADLAVLAAGVLIVAIASGGAVGLRTAALAALGLSLLCTLIVDARPLFGGVSASVMPYEPYWVMASLLPLVPIVIGVGLLLLDRTRLYRPSVAMA
jgi:hypothetical protein